jgi:hypothetical protein
VEIEKIEKIHDTASQQFRLLGPMKNVRNEMPKAVPWTVKVAASRHQPI